MGKKERVVLGTGFLVNIASEGKAVGVRGIRNLNWTPLRALRLENVTGKKVRLVAEIVEPPRPRR